MMAFSREELESYERLAREHPDPAVRAAAQASFDVVLRRPVREAARDDATEQRLKVAQEEKSSEVAVMLVGRMMACFVGAAAILLALTEAGPLSLQNTKLQVGVPLLGFGALGGKLSDLAKKLGVIKGSG